MARKKLVIAFDIDDTLNLFTEAIIKRCEEKFGHPFPFNEVEWGFENYKKEETEFVHQLFRNQDFIESVPFIDGAIELLEEIALNRGHNIVFPTSTYSNVMSTRAMKLYEHIPFIHPRNYIMTGRKDLIKTDILFDDCFSHIKASISDIPVLVNKPWNLNEKGYVRAEQYHGTDNILKQYLDIIDMAEEGLTRQDIYKIQNPNAETHGPYIVIIVGGSGVGKSTILNKVIEINNNFEKLVTNTSRDPRDGEKNCVDYFFRNKEEFENMISTGQMLEYTQYAGNYYGTSKNVVDDILQRGKNVIAIMDTDGVRHMREAYPDRTYAILLSREKKDLIRSIMERDVPIEDKINRISQLDGETKDAEICDYRVLNTDIAETAQEIINIFKG